ncbi:MAG: acyl carrier protein [Acidimicrobiales bacterium]|jgi:acyl carrier protein|nr:acyl carrier protein [Acidimicrobiales bacterium]MDG1845763.1 acyl carrier protein [Acidimicrobiales bacterium]|tara:strand:- start:325 stop:561 length:237 start_codon:yes stop_codon:yes gene_type:complete
MSEENFERFKKCAVEVLSVDASQVTKEARFAEDLDADSLDLVELVMELEEEFDVTVEEEELQALPTVGDAFTLISNKL